MERDLTEINEIFSYIQPLWVFSDGFIEAWKTISDEDKCQIKTRVDEQFEHGFPVEIKHDKTLYIYLFSLLAELEVVGSQIPLRYKELDTKKHQNMLHQQLLDEMFHFTLFAKIAFELSAPHAYPPTPSKSVKNILDMLRKEDKVLSIVLLNIIAESWIEQFFLTLQKHGIAPKMFDVILEDEKRHMSEVQFYIDLGLPSKEALAEKLAVIEDYFVTDFVYQETNLFMLEGLIGFDGCVDCIAQLDKGYRKELKKVGLSPTKKWDLFIRSVPTSIDFLLHNNRSNKEIKKTPIRNLMAMVWDEPSLPTMSSSFSIDVTPINFFEKTFPSETLTVLMLQAFSKMAAENDMFRNYIYNKKIYQAPYAYFGLAIHFPEFGDHLAFIEFKDCHLDSFKVLASKIKKTIPLVGFCFKRARELESLYPHLALFNEERYDYSANNFYPNLVKTSPCVKFSNVGHWGYEETVSPLMPGDTVKVTINAVQKKQIWNNKTKAFEARDIVNVSMSGDHRVFDGNIPAKKILQEKFNEVFEDMITNPRDNHAESKANILSVQAFSDALKKVESINVDYFHKLLHVMSFVWKDYLTLALQEHVNTLRQHHDIKEIVET